MKLKKECFDHKNWHVKLWVYVAVLFINAMILVCVGVVYIANTKAYSRKLFDENINNVENLNAASANAAYTYINSMRIKIEDIVSYIRQNNMSLDEIVQYLGAANTNQDRQFQLVLSGAYAKTGEISFGDYSGISIRKRKNKDGELSTIEKKIVYGSGYYDIFKCFTDVHDKNFNGLCFTPEYTDPDSKRKCFAVYQHITVKDEKGKEYLYTLLLAVNSKTALNAYNMQNKYQGQSTVLINEDGDYIIKNNEYRNVNFYDYIVNYNGLTFDKKAEIKNKIVEAVKEGKPTTNLFYKNHKGNECIFSVTVMENHWYSVTCVPIASFNLKDDSINYAFFILILFGILFMIDAISIYFIGMAMNDSIKIANQAQEEADHANQAKSRFLSTMTHELRTPLNAIIGLTSLAGDSIDDSAILKDYLEKIDISSKLLLQLISDILDISAIENNKIKLNCSEFDLMKLLTSLSTIYYDQCASKGIEFNVILKNMHSETLLGDSVRVNQILLNFLSNAVKFTPGGGKITLKVEQIERVECTAFIRFSITDTGCGVSDELKKRLFMPFERVIGDDARKYSGTGLGLSITKSLVELMKGQVGVESKEGEGACFWALIPFPVLSDQVHESFSAIDQLRILAVINNEEEREYIGNILVNFGIKHSLKENAKEAFERLKEERGKADFFDLCLLDWKMSDLTAIDATKQIRKEFGSKDLKIVVLAYDLFAVRMDCIEAGADYVFGKPVFSSAFYNFLEEMNSNQVKVLPVMTQKYNLNGKRILLVEDNKMNMEIAKIMLKKVGIEVVIAENGQIACDVFAASKPDYFDLILMDIQMPVMNGYEATRTIRKSMHKQAEKIPILAMTADAFLEDVEKAHDAGMNEHLAKPIVRENLYATLEKYLGENEL